MTAGLAACATALVRVCSWRARPAFRCCRLVIWKAPCASVVLITSSDTSAPPSSPTSSKMNGARGERRRGLEPAGGPVTGPVTGLMTGLVCRGALTGRAGRVRPAVLGFLRACGACASPGGGPPPHPPPPPPLRPPAAAPPAPPPPPPH